MLELAELVAGGTELFHLFLLLLDLVQAHVALFIVLGGALADVFVAVGEVIYVFVYFPADIIAGPAFALHEAEEGLQAGDLEIYVAPVALEGVILAEAVYKLLHQLNAFEVADGVEGGLFKEAEVVLDNVVAKGVEGVDINLVGIRADELGQSSAHGHHTSIGIGKAEDIGGIEMGIAEQDLPDAGGEDLGLSGARPGNDHDGSFYLVNGFLLLGVKAGVFLFKFLQESFSGGGHFAKLGKRAEGKGRKEEVGVVSCKS